MLCAHPKIQGYLQSLFLKIQKHDEAELKEADFDLRAFQSAMSVLILQQWQKEGKIDIGIMH